MRQASILASARVRCGGHVHTIELTKDGTLVLHDHPHLREEFAFLALGGKTCRCLQVLQAWRQKDVTGVPEPLRNPLRAARDKARRRMERLLANIDPLHVPFAVRAARRTVRMAQEVLTFCAYRCARSRWAGGGHYVQVTTGLPGIIGYARQVWSENGKWSGRDSHITATVPLTWLARVYKRGLAAVDGVFVLDILAENEHGIIVLAGRQGRGFEVYPCRAIVTRAADGQYHIRRWIKEAK